MKIKTGLILVCIYLFVCISSLSAKETTLTILHTNDLHSHLLGYAPNKDYTPEITGDDDTRGGWARIATAIKTEKAKRNHPVLVLDGGDFLMGSLFHMISREEAVELKIMGEMGYDAVNLGNHEFDLTPDGLARILKAAAKNEKLPKVISSSLIFNTEKSGDDTLEEQYKKGRILPYTVLEKGSLRIGIFGLMGKDAAEVAPFASPVKFAEPAETARRMVSQLRDQEKVDIVICLSHSGLSDTPEKSEDMVLAQEVPGIDVIVSGHTHTKVEAPIRVNDTLIVQSGDYGHYLGALDISLNQGKARIKKYELIPIDDHIKGDEKINKIINASIETINRDVLKAYDLSFGRNLVETDFDLIYKNDETNLGNLITDAIRWAVNKAEYDPADPMSWVQLSVQSNGVIRDEILKGKTGLISVSDLFRAVPLGIGLDGTMSYPLATCYITGAEIKKTMEILTTIYPLKGSDYFLQFSGAKISYNPNRMLFDRVTAISLEQKDGTYQPLDVSEANPQLYKISTNFYNATFLKVIGGFTSNILTIVPKDRHGNPIEDLATRTVDGDRSKPGIQEIKDWTALMGYVQTFPDTNGNGIGDIPERYRGTEGRQLKVASLNPYNLLSGGNYLTWGAFAALVFTLFLLGAILYITRRILRRRKSRV